MLLSGKRLVWQRSPSPSAPPPRRIPPRRRTRLDPPNPALHLQPRPFKARLPRGEPPRRRPHPGLQRPLSVPVAVLPGRFPDGRRRLPPSAVHRHHGDAAHAAVHGAAAEGYQGEGRGRCQAVGKIGALGHCGAADCGQFAAAVEVIFVFFF